MIDARISGGRGATDLARRLDGARNGGLRSELDRAVAEATRDVPAAAARNARERLPARGGLAAAVAGKAKHESTPIPGGRRLSATAPLDVSALDRGRLRHPLYGNRGHWYTQKVPAHWWTDAVKATAPKVQAAGARAVRRAIGSSA